LLLDFDGKPRDVSKSGKSVKGLVAVALFGVVAVLGSTLAANISLNSGSAIEFGQGVAVASACDNDGITATPISSFANVSAGGGFNFSTVSFSGVSSNCLNKVFTLMAYGDTSATPLTIATSGSTTFQQATFTWATTGAVSGAIEGTSGWDFTLGKLSIGFKGTEATSGAVYKLSLQSSAS
jgi:hypothetical protein